MATQDDDRYKSEGKLTFKLEKFAEFALQAYADRYSDPIFIQGIPWKICVQKTESSSEYMGIFLCCEPEKPKNSAWSCEASYTLKILPQKEGDESYDDDEDFHKVFCKQTSSWGRGLFQEFEELLHPDNGWYDAETDSITIEADVKAKIPRGLKMFMGKQWHRVAKDWLLDTSGDSICSIEFVDPLDADNNKEFKVHKNVLALHSDVFRTMFANKDTKESKESRVTIQDSTQTAINQMLFYVYSGKLPSVEFKQEEAVELLKVADKYNIEPLAVHSEEKLMDSVAVENVCALLMLADLHKCHSLRIVCSKVIRENLVAVKKQGEWAKLKKSSPDLAIAILEELSKEDFK